MRCLLLIVLGLECQALLVHHASGGPPETPERPGCYVWAASGCPRIPKVRFKVWARDSRGEALFGAAANPKVCEIRRDHYAALCGSEDMQVCFVPAAGPRTPCGMLAAAAAGGAPADVRSAAAAGAGGNATAEAAVAAEALLGPMAPEDDDEEAYNPPSEGLSDGTLAQPEAALHEAAARHKEVEQELQQKAAAARKVEEAAAELPRRTDAPSQDIADARATAKAEPTGAQLLFGARALQRAHDAEAARPSPGTPQQAQPQAAAAPAEGALSLALGATGPSEPGCYIRSPAGCPKNPEYMLARWLHDYYGERRLAALTNRTACEVVRRAHFAGFCGVPEMEAMFVAAPAPAASEAQ